MKLAFHTSIKHNLPLRGRYGHLLSKKVYIIIFYVITVLAMIPFLENQRICIKSICFLVNKKGRQFRGNRILPERTEGLSGETDAADGVQ
jgi:hypothetical protein